MISILCPTRKRTSNMTRLYRSIMDTALNPKDIELIFYIDVDDHASISLSRRMSDYLHSTKVKSVIGPRILLSQMWNKCYNVSSGEVLGFICDEAVFRTKGWDSNVLEAINSYEDRIVLVYGKDGIQDHREFGAYFFVHKNWAETIGYLAPPYFSCDFNDSWLNEVAKRVGRHKRIDINIEHMHFSKGKAPKDETHKERMKRGRLDNVRAQYKALAPQRTEDVQKLQEFIDGYQSMPDQPRG